MAKKFKGFTLVELLVVIGILAILIGLLLPSLNKAREGAVKVQCLSNIRQDAMAFQIYALDFKGYIPLEMMQGNGSNFWMWPAFMCYGWNFGISPTAPPANSGFKPYVNNRAAMCPYSIRYQDNVNAVQPNEGYGIYVADASNSHFRDLDQFQQELELAPPGSMFYPYYNPNWTLFTQKVSKTISVDGVQVPPASLIMLGDSFEDHQSMFSGSNSFACFTSVADQNVIYSGWQGGPYNSAIQTVHGLYANVAFYDGHAESMTAKGLRASPGQHINCTYNKYGQRVETFTAY